MLDENIVMRFPFIITMAGGTLDGCYGTLGKGWDWRTAMIWVNLVRSIMVAQHPENTIHWQLRTSQVYAYKIWDPPLKKEILHS